MSFAFTLMVMLLGSSVVIAFVLQPSSEEPAAPAISRHRCTSDSLQFIRKSLLNALNLQTEPRLPAGSVDVVREQWQRALSTVSHRTQDSQDSPVAATDGGNGQSAECCSMTYEVFMKDLGWDNWVIHPPSLTVVQCARCSPEINTGQCPSSNTNVQDAEATCCQPISHEMVPVVYVDETNSVVISSVRLTRSCGCVRGNVQQPDTE